MTDWTWPGWLLAFVIGYAFCRMSFARVLPPPEARCRRCAGSGIDPECPWQAPCPICNERHKE